MHLHPHPGLNTPATSCRPIYFDHNVNTPAPTTCQAPNQAQLLNPEPFSVPLNCIQRGLWMLLHFFKSKDANCLQLRMN